jgi:hypothetical protein
MTTRKNNLSAKLGGDTQTVPGWKQQIAPAIPDKKETYTRKTYLVTSELIERVRVTAEREQVGQNELLRYLLTWALDQLDGGHHELPLEVEKSHRIKF